MGLFEFVFWVILTVNCWPVTFDTYGTCWEINFEIDEVYEYDDDPREL